MKRGLFVLFYWIKKKDVKNDISICMLFPCKIISVFRSFNMLTNNRAYLIWFCRWFSCRKDDSHIGHLYGLRPLWTRSCCLTRKTLPNALLQNVHLKKKWWLTISFNKLYFRLLTILPPSYQLIDFSVRTVPRALTIH